MLKRSMADRQICSTLILHPCHISRVDGHLALSKIYPINIKQYGKSGLPIIDYEQYVTVCAVITDYETQRIISQA